MYPDNPNPQPPQVTPIDYLNQISAPPPSNPISTKKKIMVIGGLVLALILAAVLFFASSGSSTNTSKNPTVLAVRLSTTSETIDTVYKNIKSENLRIIVSELKVALSDASAQLKPILAKSGIDVEKIDKNTAASESDAKLIETLNEAKLNGNFDQVFISEIDYKLSMITILMDSIAKTSKDEDMLTYLKNSKASITNVQTKLEEFVS